MPPAKKPRLDAEEDSSYPEERLKLAESLLNAVKDGRQKEIENLFQQNADCWLQDDLGWTALHYAAERNDATLCETLLKKGAIWAIVDHTQKTAGDVAFSLNHKEAYSVILNEGVRAEILKAVLAANGLSQPEETEDSQSSSANNEVYLKTRLKFLGEGDNQVCLDEDDNAVMMGWEKPIMLETARLLCQDHPNIEEGLEVVNVGFGLGIVDTALQAYKPKRHVIVEAHPDVLLHMRKLGWYDKPGVHIFEGRWQDWLESENSETNGVFDCIYWDTFSEHYSDLYKFFDNLPNLLRDETSRFSFFHGLGATSRLFYDVYTSVSEYHMRDIGLQVDWHDLNFGLTLGEVTWAGTKRKYWDVPSPYRCPIARLEM